jgi:hypothetical protein
MVPAISPQPPDQPSRVARTEDAPGHHDRNEYVEEYFRSHAASSYAAVKMLFPRKKPVSDLSQHSEGLRIA